MTTKRDKKDERTATKRAKRDKKDVRDLSAGEKADAVKGGGGKHYPEAQIVVR